MDSESAQVDFKAWSQDPKKKCDPAKDLVKHPQMREVFEAYLCGQLRHICDGVDKHRSPRPGRTIICISGLFYAAKGLGLKCLDEAPPKAVTVTIGEDVGKRNIVLELQKGKVVEIQDGRQRPNNINLGVDFILKKGDIIDSWKGHNTSDYFGSDHAGGGLVRITDRKSVV